MFVAVLALHKSLPTTGNIIDVAGLGAMTLNGAASLPAVPAIIRDAVTLLAIASAARDLKAGQIVLGSSAKSSTDVQLEQFAVAWMPLQMVVV